MPDGKFKVNKAAVIARLRKAQKARSDALSLGVIHAGSREINTVATEMSRYRADSFINMSEE